MNSELQQKLKTLPESPGCYMYRDKKGEILYIGKSKNLKKRVKSYFTKTQIGKTKRLVHHIHDFELILTDTEQEALLLEMTLIMKYQPPYNVMLKEEIRYLYIKITNEKNPHLVLTKDIEKDGAYYFGPYASRYMATETLELLQKLYPLCHCSGKRGRPCFYYHLGMCMGPCARNVSQEEYTRQIKKIRHFLNGGDIEVKREMKKRMTEQMEALEFERAKETNELLNVLERLTEKQKVISRDFGHRDVAHFVAGEAACAVQIFFVRNGAIVGRTAKVFEYTTDLEEMVESYLVTFYSHKNHLKPKELLVPEQLNAKLLTETLEIKVRIPKKGEKKALLNLVYENAKSALDAHYKMLEYDEQ